MLSLWLIAIANGLLIGFALLEPLDQWLWLAKLQRAVDDHGQREWIMGIITDIDPMDTPLMNFAPVSREENYCRICGATTGYAHVCGKCWAASQNATSTTTSHTHSWPPTSVAEHSACQGCALCRAWRDGGHV